MEQKPDAGMPDWAGQGLATDLMSILPNFRRRQHKKAQFPQPSRATEVNPGTPNSPLHELKNDLEVNSVPASPVNSNNRITSATEHKVVPRAEKEALEHNKEDLPTRLWRHETPKVIFPMSTEVQNILGQYVSEWLNEEKSLRLALNRLIWESPKLWQNPSRGVVINCDDGIIAKVVTGNEDYTEYTSMEYLAKKAPDIPAPKPHGLIAFGPFRVIFMSYIPGTTLKQVWPDLSCKDKSSIQDRLDDIFRRLRAIPHDTDALGGVCGEGVRGLRINPCNLFKDITTAAQFNELQFSADHHGSASYAQLLRSVLDHEDSTLSNEIVFTHGDVRTDNIMVQKDPDTHGYVVTGIIGWKYSGFYPAYHECTVLTRTLSPVDYDDWYLYLPESISPLKFPVCWAIDKLWASNPRAT